ncbi:MAG: PAS domain S-box protein [Verrucomicrobia bacterium]|nr:PAS domain S-box protein [Verrucomicrobiota bacterium]
MDGWWTPLILVATALAVAWGWIMVYRPLLQVRRLVKDLAEGRISRGFVARGSLGLEEIIMDLDRVSGRLQGISSQAERGRFSLEALLTSLSEGVVVTDLEGRIRLVNRSFLDMFGLRENPMGRTMLETVRNPEVAAAVEKTFREGSGGSLEIRGESWEGGEASTLAVNFAPIAEGNGERAGVVTVFYDLSKIRRLETVRQEFVSNLSHELRTPLSILAGYLETMEDPAVLRGAEGREVMQVLRRNCERLTLLVNDLMELSRIESGRIEIQLQPRPPAEILAEVREDWKRAFAGKKVKVEVECPEKMPLVQSDPLRTGQIFANLMDNALRFAPPGSRVKLSARRVGAKVEFCVGDEGEGIPSEKLTRIFEHEHLLIWYLLHADIPRLHLIKLLL